ncbi:MAG: ABC transporter permease subunit [Desulfobacter sp.]|nr:MAG: ABC transporter permease subunit [Desulfobacter sp.]
MVISILKCRAVRAVLALACLAFFYGTAWAGAPDTGKIFLKADNMIASGDYENAIELVMSIPTPGPGEDGAAFAKSRMLAASLFHALENVKGARAACEQVLTVFPEHAEAKNYLASLAEAEASFFEAFWRDCRRFMPSLLQGAVMTLGLTLGTMFISPVGGLFIALGRISSFAPLWGSCWFIIWFFRGTPLLLQLFFIYYGLPSLGITLTPFAAAIIGLGLNYSAYLAEIIRAGIQSIPGGQMEAAKALGMNYPQAMRRIIVPQTYKRILPPVGNEFIALIKDTALVSTIAMVELMRSADQIFNTYFNVNVLIIAAMIYLGFTTVFTLVFEKIERKVGAYEKR